jgi:hypothetical protein
VKLDAVAKEIVLENIRNALPSRWPERVRELRELGDVPIASYLHETGLEVDDIYAGGHSFTEMRRAAGFLPPDQPEGEKRLSRGLGRLLHVDDRVGGARRARGKAAARTAAHPDRSEKG